MKDLQPKDLWSIARLDGIANSLTRVARKDGEVLANNGEDGAAIVAVRFEVTLLRCDLAVAVWGKAARFQGWLSSSLLVWSAMSRPHECRPR